MRKIINTSSVWNGKLLVKRSFSLSLSLSLSLILFHSKISFCLRFLSNTEASVVMTVSLVLPLATFFYPNLSLSTSTYFSLIVTLSNSFILHTYLYLSIFLFSLYFFIIAPLSYSFIMPLSIFIST